ncbi:GNAT family N-acetyltransferase [Phycisphaeraceae bacterium D3-23]
MELTLRELIDDDLPILFEHQRDAESNRMAAFTAKDPDDRPAFDAHWAKVRAHPTVTLRTIEALQDGEHVVVGSVLVHGWFDEPEVSFGIGRAYWGRGYATAALKLFLEEITLRPLHARAASDNAGSLRVLDKCGFVITGTEHGFANARGAEIEETLLVLR